MLLNYPKFLLENYSMGVSEERKGKRSGVEWG